MCWYTGNDNYHARDATPGAFGYGTTYLGAVIFNQSHSLNGAQFTTRPKFDVTTSVKNLEAEGDMLHGSHTTTGDEVAGQKDYTSKSSLAADTVWQPWGTTGYQSYTKSYLNHANVVEISWEKGSYPGYWWVYTKSMIADDPDGNNSYDFSDANYLFASPTNAGHHS